MSKHEMLRHACLAATVAAAWNVVPSTAQATAPGTDVSVYTRVNWFHSLAMARFVALNHLTWLSVTSMSAMPAGETDSSFVLPSSTPAFDSYAMIGVGTGGGVMVTFSDPSAGLGRSFESLFPGFSEPQVADSILTGGPALSSFLDAVSLLPPASTRMGVSCTSVHFSNGVDFGTALASFSPVPEPGSMTLILGTAGYGLLMRRRPLAIAE